MLGSVEVYDFLGGLFEGEDDGVSGEDGEVGVEFLYIAIIMSVWRGEEYVGGNNVRT